ncbi:chemotaxis protein CheW [Jeotgalibaca arthritidis]|uniref:Chemotaxis protein CheW n=1 Tax=Jeotgalibaca arthritidis TaxID=1868794 RepID=A0A6G7K9L2_9LACT|nr:chemotaxis protein CheW [Jeotgalibaca arthritidis]QII81946.1 chemotaxis protein CheW [Jeotgalibaca arthritidis]
MEQFILFEANTQKIALPIQVVERIIEFDKGIAIPDTSDYLMGLHRYNDENLVLIDMNMRLFKTPIQATEDSKIIVVDWKDKKLGLAVDQVTTVQRFESNPNQKQSDENKTKYIVETFQFNDEIILHLDVEQLFQDEASNEIMIVLAK